jgi:hypothetical protein
MTHYAAYGRIEMFEHLEMQPITDTEALSMNAVKPGGI